MKLTKTKLKQIIKEEFKKVLKENPRANPYESKEEFEKEYIEFEKRIRKLLEFDTYGKKELITPKMLAYDGLEDSIRIISPDHIQETSWDELFNDVDEISNIFSRNMEEWKNDLEKLKKLDPKGGRK